ncbi:GHMP kinase [Blastocladiella britannica]|nr:GHMP kinase [Blastocladiella britannica]
MTDASKKAKAIPLVPAVASAPGKTILFGEHSVVYGKTAIATAVDLRSYARVDPGPVPTDDDSQPAMLHLCMPDVALDLHLPADAVATAASTLAAGTRPYDLPWLLSSASRPCSLEPPARDALLALVIKHHNETDAPAAPLSDTQTAAALAALHLISGILCLRGPTRSHPSLTLTLRSAIPIGSGLGSSASLCVAMAAALLAARGTIDLAPDGASLPPPAKRAHVAEASVPLIKENESSPTKKALDIINGWAFVAEKVIHGTPSGVDNTCVTFGGALAYRKESGMETLSGFSSFEFLLVDSRVPKNTKVQVGKVRARHDMFPGVIQPVLDSMDAVAQAGRTLLRGEPLKPLISALASFESPAAPIPTVEALESLIAINHALLSAIDVSHPTLDTIVAKARSHGLAAKLTGAGGGGCALVYIPTAAPVAAVRALEHELEGELGCAVFRTDVGGDGVRLHATAVVTSSGNSAHLGQKRTRADADLDDDSSALAAAVANGSLKLMTTMSVADVRAAAGSGFAPHMVEKKKQ